MIGPQDDWIEAIQLIKNHYGDLEINIALYLKMCSNHERLVDLPCYIDENVALKSFNLYEQFGSKIAFKKVKIWGEYGPGCTQILAPISDNLIDAHCCDKKIPLHFQAARRGGNIEIIKAFAPLTNNSLFF